MCNVSQQLSPEAGPAGRRRWREPCFWGFGGGNSGLVCAKIRYAALQEPVKHPHAAIQRLFTELLVFNNGFGEVSGFNDIILEIQPGAWTYENTYC